jgi:hypothetical protein
VSLTPAQIEAFERDGFVRIAGAFPREVAERCRARLWRELRLDPEIPSGWTRPVIRLIAGAEPPYREAYDTPRLRRAFDFLVGLAAGGLAGGSGTSPFASRAKAIPAMRAGMSTAASK